MALPPLPYAISPNLPPQMARSRATECTGELLGAGSRMEVYLLVDGLTVIRVPRRTEEMLIAEHGSSGRKALAAGHEVSKPTEKELHDLEAIESFIGAFVPDTTPLADLDLEGNFRYYSLQRRVRQTLDLRDNTQRLENSHSRHSLERFIRDVRDMVRALGIVPDLAGKGNLVLDRYGLVKLVDINNFRRLLTSEELEARLPAELDDYVMGFKDIRKALPKAFIDDLGLPTGDLTLARLKQLEVRGLGRDLKTVEKDPFYAPLHDSEVRRIVLGLLRTDQA
jgi:hypothetical protein